MAATDMPLWCSLFAANLPLVQLGDDYVASTNAIFTYVGNKVRHRVKRLRTWA